MAEMSAAEGRAAADARVQGNGTGGDGSLRADLPAAVGDESGNSNGAGAGEQFRRFGHGGLCGGGQDRFLRLHAPAGFWKRLFHLHRPEPRGKEKRPDPGRNPVRGQNCGDFRFVCIGCSRHFCQSVPVDFHPAGS